MMEHAYTAYSKVYETEVTVFHEYHDGNEDGFANTLYWCTWPELDNEDGYVIHRRSELDFNESNG